jgi:hypothetical protein
LKRNQLHFGDISSAMAPGRVVGQFERLFNCWSLTVTTRWGTHLHTPSGTTVTVASGYAPKKHDSWMWDLTIPGNNDQDFYVLAGGTSVLVHNCGTMYRSDMRDLSAIFPNGFEPVGSNMNLEEHVSGWSVDSGYESTTKYESIATARGGNVYWIDGVNGIDVNGALPDFPHASENEVAIPGPLPSSRIIGVTMQDGTWIDNPLYEQLESGD